MLTAAAWPNADLGTVLCHITLCGNSNAPSENTLELNKK